MASALRRSRRAVPTKTSTYNVGDIVEITRNNTLQKGRLAYRLTADLDAPNPLWLVKFIGNGSKEEELYETHFGKVLKSSADVSVPPPRHNQRESSRSSSSDGSESKRVTFSESSPTASEDSTGAEDGKAASAREERSRRRQAKTPDEEPNKRRMPSSSSKNKKQKTNNEEVVVVKLLTGTLYLYRGPHRRAEFVRRV